jgi:alanine-synthesizing transaminase
MFAERTQWNLAANRLSQSLARLRAEKLQVLDLTASNPTECGFKYDGAAILKAFINPGALKYHPDPRGLAAARQTVADYYAARGVKVSLQDLLLTTSTSEAYTFVFRLLCNPEDEILVPSPSYPLFDFLAEIEDVKLVRYPLRYDHGWHIDLHALERSITTRARGIVVVHPNNPTGHFVKAQELKRLNEVCASHGLAIIADEVFLDFALGEEKPASFTQNQAALTFTMSGLSKIAGLPQMKVAWLCLSGPEPAKREAMARLEVIADTYLSMNAPAQLALPALLAQRFAFQQQLMARVRKNLEELDRQLRENPHCSRLEVEGGWYAVVRVPATRPDEELAIALLEERGVYVHPGHFYDLAEGYIVVSLITPERDFALGMEQVFAGV